MKPRPPSVVIAENLGFDARAAAAQRMAWLGASGSGKSYGCGRYVEQLSDAGVPVILLDTVGIWAAVRLGADGQSAGLSFVVIGGDHADVPLDLSAGKQLAKFLVTQRASAVLDLSDYEPEERADFVADFCAALLPLIKVARHPMVVVFDEAQDLVPQTPAKGEQRMKAAVSALIRKGRNHACGTVVVTQRPQDIAKAAFDQVGNVFVGSLFGKHERDAMRNWVGRLARSSAVERQLDELPALQPGEFFFWSPQWLKRYEKIHVLPKRTFDGSSTTPLATDAALGKIAPVDVEALRALLKGAEPEPEPPAFERDGPRPIEIDQREQLAELERTLTELMEEREAARREASDLRDRLLWSQRSTATLEALLVRIATASRATADEIDGAMYTFASERAALPPLAELGADPPGRNAVPQRTVGSPRENGAANNPAGTLKPAAQAAGVLASPNGRKRGSASSSTNAGAVAEMTDLGTRALSAISAYAPLTRVDIAIHAASSVKSGALHRALRGFVAGGWIVETLDGFVCTPDGHENARAVEWKRGRELRDHWFSLLDETEQKAWRAMTEGPRSGETFAALCQAAGVSVKSGAFARAVRRLKADSLLIGRNPIAISPEARRAFLLP